MHVWRYLDLIETPGTQRGPGRNGPIFLERGGALKAFGKRKLSLGDPTLPGPTPRSTEHDLRLILGAHRVEEYALQRDERPSLSDSHEQRWLEHSERPRPKGAAGEKPKIAMNAK
ncbi:hypothetical protein YGS_C3P0112 (plasmid) [Sphingobium sp. YG1]|nr:hypothetical protein YGS_C3P0112 [Sphingobium sp. YG1]